MERFSEKYNEYIDKAARSGDDARAKALIKQKIGVNALIRQLDGLKANVEVGAYTAQALAELGKLPAALASCKGLLKESPNFATLGKSITSIFRDMDKTQSELEKLNEILSPAPAETFESRLSGAADTMEESAAYKAEYAAMIERIKPKSDSVVRPSVTGDLDIEGIIAEENNKR
jgi:hypothetical protein